ncbi:conserved hypothetical protein [Neisseria gonorrhoeae DGI2]|nr:Conserved hypothetical protein [Neisseria gonorrhoeae NCCP11945]APW53133.1 hypothetical protein T556_04330 [Neisseria gonorrhoeae NG-k51.05]EFE04375.1 conserved hypothetical protein [Neisseria gonorrhoeae DGI2]KAE9495707.1 hypothetical protein F9Z35_0302 [Neisseria gonorrhoeae]KAE9496977.1 hypothetical protein F9Z37_0291 [Neisseria gonorrhoeae]
MRKAEDCQRFYRTVGRFSADGVAVYNKTLDKNIIFVIINVKIQFDFLTVNQERKAIMFPEYRDLISKLKQENSRFARLFDEHNELDDKITGLANNPVTSGAETIDELKKAKLKLKDELYAILQKAAGK